MVDVDSSKIKDAPKPYEYSAELAEFQDKPIFGTAISKHTVFRLAGIALVVMVLAACGPDPAPPLPTRTPAPTFTPSPEVEAAPPDPAAAETAKAADAATAQPPAEQAAVEQPPAEQPPAEPVETDTPVPEPTPVPAAEVTIDSNMNVRGGPGTNYNIVGSANVGERYPVRGRNDAGSWWQIDYNGQDGWVFGELASTQNAETVAVALNIPAPPPPPPPTSTPVPAPQPAPQPEPQQPAPQPATNYEFNRAIVQRCDPNAGVTYVEGTTYKGGQPVSGYLVAFSYAPDGPVVAETQSGPHQGYPGWRTGYYSHILGNTGPREGNWFFWIKDTSGKRISEIANLRTDGSAGGDKCQQAVIDFDS